MPGLNVFTGSFPVMTRFASMLPSASKGPAQSCCHHFAQAVRGLQGGSGIEAGQFLALRRCSAMHSKEHGTCQRIARVVFDCVQRMYASGDLPPPRRLLIEENLVDLFL